MRVLVCVFFIALKSVSKASSSEDEQNLQTDYGQGLAAALNAGFEDGKRSTGKTSTPKPVPSAKLKAKPAKRIASDDEEDDDEPLRKPSTRSATVPAVRRPSTVAASSDSIKKRSSSPSHIPPPPPLIRVQTVKKPNLTFRVVNKVSATPEPVLTSAASELPPSEDPAVAPEPATPEPSLFTPQPTPPIADVPFVKNTEDESVAEAPPMEAADTTVDDHQEVIAMLAVDPTPSRQPSPSSSPNPSVAKLPPVLERVQLEVSTDATSAPPPEEPDAKAQQPSTTAAMPSESEWRRLRETSDSLGKAVTQLFKENAQRKKDLGTLAHLEQKYKILEGKYVALDQKFEDLDKKHKDLDKKHTVLEGNHAKLMDQYIRVLEVNEELKRRCAPTEEAEERLKETEKLYNDIEELNSRVNALRNKGPFQRMAGVHEKPQGLLSSSLPVSQCSDDPSFACRPARHARCSSQRCTLQQ